MSYIIGHTIMPKIYHCWRCETSVPMLTNEEWEQVQPLLNIRSQHIHAYREQHGVGFSEALCSLRQLASDKYREITGCEPSSVHVIWHHYLARYGDKCSTCGHLLRTPIANFCAYCGAQAK